MDWDIDIDIETSPTRGHVFLHHLIGILIVTNAADMLRDLFFQPSYDLVDKCTPLGPTEGPLMSFYLTLISNNIIIYRYKRAGLGNRHSELGNLALWANSHFRHVLWNRSQFRSSDITRTQRPKMWTRSGVSCLFQALYFLARLDGCDGDGDGDGLANICEAAALFKMPRSR